MFARTFSLFWAKVSGMPGICYASRSAAVCQESIKTWQRVVPVVGGCPSSELRQLLSERAPTDVGNHINIHVNVITNGAVKRICSHRLFKFSYFVPGKRFSLPQIILLLCFVPRKRFIWNQIYISREIEHGCAKRSDSSAQVLRNSRPEFRLLAPRNIYSGFLRFLNLRFGYK